MESNYHITVEQAESAIPLEHDHRYATLMEHGSMRVLIYAPIGIDTQEPHKQDEVYVIHSGTGEFFDGYTNRPFKPGDAIFVPAGRAHRFEKFSEDFRAWVVFYGPDGGEG